MRVVREGLRAAAMAAAAVGVARGSTAAGWVPARVAAAATVAVAVGRGSVEAEVGATRVAMAGSVVGVAPAAAAARPAEAASSVVGGWVA